MARPRALATLPVDPAPRPAGLGGGPAGREGGCRGGGHWPGVGARGAAAGTERPPRRFSLEHPRRPRLPLSVLLPGPAPPCPLWTSSCWRRRCRTAPRYLPPLRSPHPGTGGRGGPSSSGGGGREHAGAGRGHPADGAGEPEKAPRGRSLCVVTPFPESAETDAARPKLGLHRFVESLGQISFLCRSFVICDTGIIIVPAS